MHVHLDDHKKPATGQFAIPTGLLPVDPDCLLSLVNDERTRRWELLNHKVAHTDNPADPADIELPCQWLLLECDTPGCIERTEIEARQSEPMPDDGALSAALAGPGWIADEHRVRCPAHSPEATTPPRNSAVGR